MAITPAVFRVINYGGERSDSMRGGMAVEHFAVVGLGADEFEAAYNLGLPKKGTLHVNANLSFVGTVQSVKQVAELSPTLWIARVVYSQNGTFNFSSLIGSSLETGDEEIEMPVMIPAGSAGWVTYPRPFIRGTFTKVVTSRLDIPMQPAANLIALNKNKVYLFGGVEYQLQGARMVEDIGNNRRIDTYFSHRHLIRGFPAGYWYGGANRSVAIPTLQPNAIYKPVEQLGEVFTIDALDAYGPGANLPWL